MGATPSSQSGLSCPANNSAVYTTAGQSYSINCFNDSMYSDMHPLGATSNPTLESCIALCAQTDTCVAVSYIPSTRACWTKNATNSGTHNSLVWGARLLSTSTSTATSHSIATTVAKATSTTTAAAPSTSPPSSSNTPCNHVTNIHGTLVNDDFSTGRLAPWLFTGPDPNTSHPIHNDTSTAFASTGTLSYFRFNSTRQNRNTISQLVCGLYNGANYMIYVRYSFVAALSSSSNTTAAAIADERFYDLQILFNGTVVARTTLSPGMVDGEDFSTASLYFKARSSVYEVGVSWGVDQGAIAARENEWAVLEVTNIDFGIQESVGS